MSAPPPKTTSGPVTKDTKSLVGVSQDIKDACAIDFSAVNSAPKFDYDQADLSPADRDILSQVARCVTTGPMKGRGLALTGRADPRGEQEYNMSLGGHRASAVRTYLSGLGVPQSGITLTSRGELDATGKDEQGWRDDRRVDIALAR